MSSEDPSILESQEQLPIIIPLTSSQPPQLSGLPQEDVSQIAAVVTSLVYPHGASQQNPLSSSEASSADLSATSLSTITTVAGK